MSKRYKYKRWTKEEDAYLLRLRKCKKTYLQIEDILDRAAKSIAQRFYTLNRQNKKQVAAPPMPEQFVETEPSYHLVKRPLGCYKSFHSVEEVSAYLSDNPDFIGQYVAVKTLSINAKVEIKE